MLDVYEKDYIRDTKKNLSEANVEQLQNQISALSDRIKALQDGKGDDPIKNANIDKQIASIKIKIETLRKQKINETFPIANKALSAIKGNGIIHKILDIIGGKYPVSQDKTNIVIKKLKNLGMDDDEINELRDIFVKIYKNNLDKIGKSHFGDLNDLYETDKNLFCVYKINYQYIKYANANKKTFVKDLTSSVEKDFKIAYEKRIKNRQYGKTKEQELDKKEKREEEMFKLEQELDIPFNLRYHNRNK